jgi:hypothetical protein
MLDGMTLPEFLEHVKEEGPLTAGTPAAPVTAQGAPIASGKTL